MLVDYQPYIHQRSLGYIDNQNLFRIILYKIKTMMIISDLFEWRQSLRIFYFCIFWLLLPSHIDDLAIIRPEMFTLYSISQEMSYNICFFVCFLRSGGNPSLESYTSFLTPSLITLFTKSKLLPEHDCGIKFSRI